MSQLLENRFAVRVLRQDRPGVASYWQTFHVTREPGMNVTSVLQRIAANPKNGVGKGCSTDSF
jgi:succinate dehydrogenase / fumarate reductase iron-sulfur subunit